MPYRISSARRGLESKLSGLQDKVSKANPIEVDPTLRQFAIASGVFLAHAEFENYFSELMDGVARTCLAANVFPDQLRAHLFCDSLNLRALVEKVAGGAGESNVYSHVLRKVEKFDGLSVEFILPVERVTGDGILSDLGYPSRKNIEKVLKRVGIENPKTELDKAVKRDVFSLLGTVSDLRTALAHSAQLPGISCRDVVERIENLKIVARAIDKALYAALVPLVRDAGWIRGMV